MNFETLKNKNISLIIWNTETENDVHVYVGKLYFENAECYFINQEKGWRVSLDKEQLSRLKPIPDNFKETLLNADYALLMSMDNLPETGTNDMGATGMKWHD